jgi:cyclic beta-1,2-glucan synthetase
VLDPVLSLRRRVRVPRGGQVRLSFATGVAVSHAAAIALAEKYDDPASASRTFALSTTQTQMRMNHLGISSEEARLYDELASHVLWTDEALRAEPGFLERNRLGQSGLWPQGISGDHPILAVRVVEENDLPLVRQVLRAQEYWRLKGLTADVAVLNEHPASYLDEMHEALQALLDNGPWAAWKHRPGGAYLLRADGMSEDERNLLLASARAVLRGDLGELTDQLRVHTHETEWPAALVPTAPAAEHGEAIEIEPPALTLANEFGGFTADGREYAIVMRGDDQTPLPWVNVIANPRFGTVIGASGASWTWAINSRENRLTPFGNDTVGEWSGEALYLRDEDDGEVWGATPGPMPRRDRGRWVTRHGAGSRTSLRAVTGSRLSSRCSSTPRSRSRSRDSCSPTTVRAAVASASSPITSGPCAHLEPATIAS